MVSDVAICNMALNHIGSTRTLNDLATDRGKEAETCRRFFNHSLELLLTNAHIKWGFSVQRRTLTQLEGEERPRDWLYVYVYPSDCLRALDFIYESYYGHIYYSFTTVHSNYSQNGTLPYEIGKSRDGKHKVIFTDYTEVDLKYISATKNGASFYTPGFVDCLTYLLASKIAIPLTQKKALRDDNFLAFEKSLDVARVADALEEEEYEQQNSEFIAYRGADDINGLFDSDLYHQRRRTI